MKVILDMGKQAPKRMPEWQLFGRKNNDAVMAEYKTLGGRTGHVDLTVWTKAAMSLYDELSLEQKSELAEEVTASYEEQMEVWRSGVDGIKGEPANYDV